MRLFYISLLIYIATNANCQEPGYPNDLFSRPERTQFQETSLHNDVLRFVEALAAESNLVHYEMMGSSSRGKQLPLVIMANPKVENASEAHTSGKILVYIQANIHGGEVEGKEALLTLMREIAFGQKKYLLDNQILLFCPLFNPDGNDDIGPNNRPNQDGSPYLAGKRANGQGFDLNRDGLKLETPEGQALAAIFKTWNPDTFVDLHTTNGTWHGYEITCAPGVTTVQHPATEAYMKEEFIPWMTTHLLERTGFNIYYYGSFYEYPPKQFWGMYPEPRFMTNAFALKNKLTLLVETFSHDHFEKRILSNVHFVSAFLEYTNKHSGEIKLLLKNTEQAVVDEIENLTDQDTKGVSFDYSDHPETSDLLVYQVESGTRTGKKQWFPNVNAYLGMQAQNSARVPKAYVFPEELSSLAEKLKQHGVIIHQLEQQQDFTGQKFEVTALNNANRSYQGHYPATLEGAFIDAEISVPAGSWFVDMAQPLAYLIFYLLEPEADDGLVYWNYFDAFLNDRGIGNNRVDFPVFKVFSGSSSSQIDDTEEIEIFFNPDTQALTLSGWHDQNTNSELELLSMDGRVLIHSTIPAGSKYAEVSCPDLPVGIYLVKLQYSSQTKTRKIFIRLKE